MVEKTIDNKKSYIFKDSSAENILIQAIDENDFKLLKNEYSQIKNMTDKKFSLFAFLVDDWNCDLSPWVAPAVFGNENFGNGANATLKFIEEKLLPFIKEDCANNVDDLKFYIGGYSLSALFALWAVYNTDIFSGVAAASPSVWFPNFITFANENKIRTNKIYLSLGDKEEKTKNKTMATVGDNIKKYHSMILENDKKVILEWNQGNHFIDSDLRTAKAFAWVLNDI